MAKINLKKVVVILPDESLCSTMLPSSLPVEALHKQKIFFKFRDHKRRIIAGGIEDMIRNIKAVERAVLGFMCNQIIDMGRSMWIKECGFEAEFVKYVPPSISPENHLLIAKRRSQLK